MSSSDEHYISTFGKTLNELQAEINTYSEQGKLPDLMRLYLRQASDASYTGNHKIASQKIECARYIFDRLSPPPN